MADKYGIPAGGDAYPGKVKFYKGNQKKLASAYLHEAVAKGGWPDNLRNTAVAVAMAESGGQPYIYNTYKKGHFGLFQISRSAWPAFFALGNEQWTDPVANARQAYAIYKRQGWGAWQAHTEGKHKDYLDDAEEGVLTEDDSSLLDDLGVDVPDPLGGIGDVLAGAWESITTPALWMRLAYGGTGVVLIAGGLFLIVRNTPAGKAAVSTTKKAVSAVPAGRAAQAMRGA